MQGTIRSYDEKVRTRVCQRIKQIAEDVGKAMECKVEVVLDGMYPAIVNHEKETEHVERIAT